MKIGIVDGVVVRRGKPSVKREEYKKLAADAVAAYAKETNLPLDVARDALVLSGWNRLTNLANYNAGNTDKKRGAPGRKSKPAKESA